jgi:hypothetical protein
MVNFSKKLSLTCRSQLHFIQFSTGKKFPFPSRLWRAHSIPPFPMGPLASNDSAPLPPFSSNQAVPHLLARLTLPHLHDGKCRRRRAASGGEVTARRNASLSAPGSPSTPPSPPGPQAARRPGSTSGSRQDGKTLGEKNPHLDLGLPRRRLARRLTHSAAAPPARLGAWIGGSIADSPVTRRPEPGGGAAAARGAREPGGRPSPSARSSAAAGRISLDPRAGRLEAAIHELRRCLASTGEGPAAPTPPCSLTPRSGVG